MLPPKRDPSTQGMKWWSKLTAEQKSTEVAPLIQHFKMSNARIADYLALDTINMVANVRNRIKRLGIIAPGSPPTESAPARCAATRKQASERRSAAERVTKTYLGKRVPPENLSVIVNPTPERQLTEEEEIALLAALIAGSWKPTGKARPYLTLLPSQQRRVQKLVVDFFDRRESLL